MIGKRAGRLSLERCDLFQGLGPGVLDALSALGRRRQARAGESLLLLGQETMNVSLVESGKVSLSLPLKFGDDVREVTVLELEAGAAFGWSALVPPHASTMGVRVMDDAVLLVFGRGDLQDFFCGHPQVERTVFFNLAKMIAKRLGMLRAIVVRDLQRWVDEKLG